MSNPVESNGGDVPVTTPPEQSPGQLADQELFDELCGALRGVRAALHPLDVTAYCPLLPQEGRVAVRLIELPGEGAATYISEKTVLFVETDGSNTPDGRILTDVITKRLAIDAESGLTVTQRISRQERPESPGDPVVKRYASDKNYVPLEPEQQAAELGRIADAIIRAVYPDNEPIEPPNPLY